MVSREVCETEGRADMPALIVTVNHVFMQTIEHIDRPGCTGNLVDVLSMLSDGDSRDGYRSGRPDCRRHRLLDNQPMEVLMVPPEHRGRVRPLLDAIHGIQVPKAAS
jgi:hypothetical protein